MYAYGNHICVKIVETNLVIIDFGVVATFITNSNPIKAHLEYVKWVEKNLELDFGTTCVIVLF
jgi:hypothetical protein